MLVESEGIGFDEGEYSFEVKASGGFDDGSLESPSEDGSDGLLKGAVGASFGVIESVVKTTLKFSLAVVGRV